MTNMDDVDRISEVYKNQTIFISGGTGFLGKVLIEKLLRSTEVKAIYVLIRHKRGKSPKERLQEIFQHPFFDLLKKQKPQAVTKCKPIAGDVVEDNLGISEDDQKLLKNEVNMMFHSAATTRFDSTLKYALMMNTRGTKYMLDLAKECKKLKLFVHVSTAYAFPNEEIVYEKVYDSPANPADVLSSINWIEEDTLEKFSKELLKDIPNTYTFTKALGEGLVNEQVGKLPVIIVRPAIVVPVWKEPVPGWSNTLQGPLGLFVGAGKGVIRSMYLKSNAHANFLPVDITINGILIAGWDYLSKKQQHIFNLTTPKDELTISWEQMINIGKDVVYNRIPFNQILWYPGGGLYSSRLVHNFNFLFFQLIPAIFVDILLFILGYPPVLFQIQKRIRKSSEMFEYYTTKSWTFDSTYSTNQRKTLTAKERKVYKIDKDGLDLHDYFESCIRAARIYILKETDDMIPRARLVMKIMYFVDKICKGTIIIVALVFTCRKLLLPLLDYVMEYIS